MNRFITTEDPCIDEALPHDWWSRRYEYKFALDHVNKKDVVLDAGTGVKHPLKYMLDCKQVDALDKNRNILNFKRNGINYIVDDILTYQTSTKYDKILLIGVLHHTKDNLIEKLENLKNLLADGGKIIITSDAPTLDPRALEIFAKQAGLETVGKCDWTVQDNAITSQNLNVYGMILTNRSISYKTKIDKPKRTKRGT